MTLIKTVDRRGSDCDKWNKYAGTDILPMWIADSEFEIAEPIQKALAKRLQHKAFGYAVMQQNFKEAVKKHCRELYNWEIDTNWVVAINGVVPALNVARAVSAARGRNEGVTIDPIYPHLRKGAPLVNFKTVSATAKLIGDRYTPDFDDIRTKITTNTGLLLLCHPQNPTGVVYSDAELNTFAEIAKEHDLIVCSDEIHCDLILDGSQHKPFASLNSETEQRTITLMAASKTFNIAGLICAFAIIPNEQLRAEFLQLRAGLAADVNTFGYAATIAAFEEGETWRQSHIKYLCENEAIVRERINATGILKMQPVHATFLALIDARGLNVPNPQKFFEEHGVGMNDGADFGAPGFVRLNFGCGREMLNEALMRIEKAVQELKK